MPEPGLLTKSLVIYVYFYCEYRQNYANVQHGDIVTPRGHVIKHGTSDEVFQAPQQQCFLWERGAPVVFFKLSTSWTRNYTMHWMKGRGWESILGVLPSILKLWDWHPEPNIMETCWFFHSKPLVCHLFPWALEHNSHNIVEPTAMPYEHEEVSPPTLLWGAVGSHGPLRHHTVSLTALTHHAHGLLSLIVLPSSLGWRVVCSGRLLVHHRDWEGGGIIKKERDLIH